MTSVMVLYDRWDYAHLVPLIYADLKWVIRDKSTILTDHLDGVRDRVWKDRNRKTASTPHRCVHRTTDRREISLNMAIVLGCRVINRWERSIVKEGESPVQGEDSCRWKRFRQNVAWSMFDHRTKQKKSTRLMMNVQEIRHQVDIIIHRSLNAGGKNLMA